MADNRYSNKQYTADFSHDRASSGLDMMFQYLQSNSITPTSYFTVRPTEVTKSENGSVSSSHESNNDDDEPEKPPSQGPLGRPKGNDDVILDRKQFLSAGLQSTRGLSKCTWLCSGDSTLISFLFKRLPPLDNPLQAHISPFDRLDQNVQGAAFPLALYAVLQSLPLFDEDDVHIFQFAGTEQGIAALWVRQVWYFIFLGGTQLEELRREWPVVSGTNMMAGA
ncbi:hypothetical protein HD553DRAFT_343212 [Filobasidium floriforme]|uniref:uncharacterized protein n=1 Tax=Filobasidium floriforme TaxID=5210 RepID=UPI001E8D9C10|nr:uncharacterized protein HD553DRAFT_343212 [Filobasidium floriforme]KAH8083219.1 hypothetical protein HD553DRAFT_343212 [Filobasidium floriforme]